MFESIYLDLTDADALRVSQYTVLLDRLREVESAQKIHDGMVERTGRIHANRVKKAQEALAAEVGRLRREVEVSRKK